MATKRLVTSPPITVTATDVSNGYIDVKDTYEIDVQLLFRVGAENSVFTENSPTDGLIAFTDLSEGEVIRVQYLY